ncbi:hypothetical protein CMEL01_02334, partial [Colletotrichum melonis]
NNLQREADRHWIRNEALFSVQYLRTTRAKFNGEVGDFLSLTMLRVLFVPWGKSAPYVRGCLPHARWLGGSSRQEQVALRKYRVLTLATRPA